MALKRFTGIIISLFFLIECINISVLNVFLYTVSGAVITESLGDNLTYTYDTSTDELVISGTGDMIDGGKVYYEGLEEYVYVSPFESATAAKTVIIESGITSISKYAFYHFTNLTSVSIPDTVTNIDDYAFDYCKSLTEITIPDSVTNIGYYAFNKCTSLENVNISSESTLTSIGYSAFSNCTALMEITIPDSVTSISHYAFNTCTALENVNISSESTLTSIGIQAFYKTALTNITIPSSVTEIYIGAFSSCGFTTAGPIGGGYDYEFGWTKEIPAYAFDGCSSLTSVEIPDSVTSIGVSAFEECAISDITIPSGVTYIRASTFSDCTKLSSINIPSGVTDIGKKAFYNCTSLSSLEIPSSVTSIGDCAFENCKCLVLSVEESNSAYATVNGVLFDYALTELIWYPISSTDTSYEIPNSVTSIVEGAFRYCRNLAEITIPESVESIGEQAFYYCTGLTSVTILDSATSIDRYAFYYCTSLTSITIPSSVTSISSLAFTKSGLTMVYCYEGSEADNSSLYPSGVTIVYLDDSGSSDDDETTTEETTETTTEETTTEETTETTTDETTSEETTAEETTASGGNSSDDETESTTESAAVGDDDAQLKVSSPANAKLGNTVEVKVILRNVDVIAGGEFVLSYDAEKVSPADTYYENGAVFTDNNITPVVNNSSEGTVSVAFVTSNTANFDAEGTLMTFIFETIAEGNAEFNISSLSFSYKVDNKYVDLDIASVSSSTTIGTYIPGDVNDDNEIGYMDAVYVLRNSTGIDDGLTDDQLAACDVNKDNSVNYKDALYILDYSAGNISSFDEIS